jgi:NAD(P)H-hydrate repair Nnr-like enzyme with NAD(P)H-hydrate dehydratase domain
VRAAQRRYAPDAASCGSRKASWYHTGRIQEDRIAAARALAERYNTHVVLKGNGSVLVARDGHLFINTTGNPGMASAGMGDVLSGILGALLAQRSLRRVGAGARRAPARRRGRCARSLDGVGPVGLTAGELPDVARRLWNGWLTRKML